MGQCEITQLESGVIDVERVFTWLDDFVNAHNLDVQAICFDPAQYGPLLTQIEKNHPEWQQIQIRQGT
nr:phage terminase family protein [Limosilactobacillus fermentum]